MKNYLKFLIWFILVNDTISYSKYGMGGGFYQTTTINDVLIQIFKVCNENYKNILLYQLEGFDKIVSDTLWTPRHLSIINFDENSIINKTNVQYETKVDAVLIINYSMDKLEHFIFNLPSVPWWEFYIPFYIVDRSNTYCSEMYNIFKSIHLTEVLKVYFICQNAMMEFLIYTSNPFTDYAPLLWSKYHTPGGDPIEKVDLWAQDFNTMKQKNPLNWTVFEEQYDTATPQKTSIHWVIYERQYDADFICDQFDFDRTKFLNKYPIKLGVQAEPPKAASSETNMRFPMFTYKDDDYLADQDLKKTLNIVFDPSDIQVPHSSIKTNFSELFNYFQTLHDSLSFVDFIPSEVNYLDKWTFDNTFPVKWIRFGILSQNKGYKTPLEKIRDFYGIWVLISMIVILSITFFVIYMSKNRNKGFAVFEILRLLINASIFIEINTPPRKIYFCMVFLYFLVIHATFSGRLAEFLTKPQLQDHPETLEDLKDPMYRGIAVTGLGASILTDQTLIDKMIVFVDPVECIEAVVNDSSVVCIENYNNLLQNTFIHNLHINKQPFGLRYITYLIRRRWKLKHRINEFYIRLMENGISEAIQKREYDKFIIKIQVMNATKDDYFRPIDLKTLNFGFLILIAGWIGATVIFCIEQLMQKKKITHKVDVSESE